MYEEEKKLAEKLIEFMTDIDPYEYNDVAGGNSRDDMLENTIEQLSLPSTKFALDVLHHIQSYAENGNPSDLSEEERATNAAVKSISDEVKKFMKVKTASNIVVSAPDYIQKTAEFEDKLPWDAVYSELDNVYGREKLVKELSAMAEKQPEIAGSYAQAIENICIYNQMRMEQQLGHNFTDKECLVQAASKAFYGSHKNDVLPVARYGNYTAETKEFTDEELNQSIVQTTISMNIGGKLDPFAVLSLNTDSKQAILEFLEEADVAVTDKITALENFYAETFAKSGVEFMAMYPERFEEIEFSEARCVEKDDDGNVILSFEDEDERINLNARVQIQAAEMIIDKSVSQMDIDKINKLIITPVEEVSGTPFIDPDNKNHLCFNIDGTVIEIPLTSTEKKDMAIYLEDVEKGELLVERNQKMNELINNEETTLIFDAIESAGFEVRYNGDDRYAVFDTSDGSKYAEGFEKPSEVIDVLSTFVADYSLDGLAKDAREQGFDNVPQTCDEWREAIIRPDMQEFVEGHKTEIAEMLLISNPQRIDEKVDMKELADMFKEPSRGKEDLE